MKNKKNKEKKENNEYTIEDMFNFADNPCAMEFRLDGKSAFKFIRNPNSNYQPDEKKLKRAKKYLDKIKPDSKFSEKLKEKSSKSIEKCKIYKDNLDIRPEIAWLLAEQDKEYAEDDVVAIIFDYETINSIQKYFEEFGPNIIINFK